MDHKNIQSLSYNHIICIIKRAIWSKGVWQVLYWTYCFVLYGWNCTSSSAGKLLKCSIIFECLQLWLLVICLSAWSPEEGACCRLLHDISPMQARQLTEPIWRVHNRVERRGCGIHKNKIWIYKDYMSYCFMYTDDNVKDTMSCLYNTSQKTIHKLYWHWNISENIKMVPDEGSTFNCEFYFKH